MSAHTGGVLAEITVEATPEGYEELVEFADEHSGLRAWAIEGTGGHGAGLTRHLAKNDELVVELDRPGARSAATVRSPIPLMPSERLGKRSADQARHAEKHG